MKDIKLKELGKGVLIILSYFIGANLLAIIFSLLIKRKIIPNLKYTYNIIIYLIVLFIYILIYKKELIKNFKIFKKEYKNDLKRGINYWLKGLFIMLISNYILLVLFKLGASTNETNNIVLIKSNFILQSILIIFIAPFIEELVFRFSFRNMTKNKHLYAYITGIIFGFVHVISSLNNPLKILLLIPYSSMGVALGYSFKDTNNIFTSLSIHIIHNILTLLIILYAISLGVY